MPGNYIIDEFFDDSDLNICNMKCDVYLQDNNYYIDIDVPGYEKSALKVEYSNGYLSVTGTKKQLSSEELKKYIKKERCYGVYKRQFYVGEIDSSKINAKYKDGVLSIVVPKAKEEVSKVVNIK